jgi:hypothetical protein
LAKLDIGRQIIATTLELGTPKPFLDRGWDLSWAEDPENFLRLAVFPDPHGEAWRHILRYWDRHGKVPSKDVFRFEFQTYELPDIVANPDELVDLAGREIKQVAALDAHADLAGYLDLKDWDGYAERAARISKLVQDQDRSLNTVVVWDGAGQEVDDVINRDIKRGIDTGIPGFDTQPGFFGFGNGDLITYLGRAKAGKTSFALLTALHAWEVQYKRVLIVTFEIAAANFNDRLNAYLAGISLTRLRTGDLHEDEKRRLRRVFEDKGRYEESMFIVQPNEAYTVTDLETDIDKYQPEFVCIDGFYFMVDRDTGKSGGNWEGHDNLARDLKRTALRHDLPTLVTHQVREKQITGKKGAGIDDGAMMGGTGLIMASSAVVGVDMDADQVNKLSWTRGRDGYLKSVRGEWDWETCVFNELEDETAYLPDDDADEAPF